MMMNAPPSADAVTRIAGAMPSRSCANWNPCSQEAPMPKYDRELIARMLETPAVFEDASRREQARLLREAENLEADARTAVISAASGEGVG